LYTRTLPPFADLSAFVAYLESAGQLRRVALPVSVHLDATEIHRRTIAAGGPALLFERPVRADGSLSDIPLLTNLFGTVERVAWALGTEPSRLDELGELMAELRAPRPPGTWRELRERWPLARAALAARPRIGTSAAVQEVVLRDNDVDLWRLPVQTCWPGDAGPLITWPVVVTMPPDSAEAAAANLGVYRMQPLSRDRAILRWLAARGGARHHRMWREAGKDMPVAVVIGADPATIMAAVMPLPETVGEYAIAGLLGGSRPRLARGVTVPVPIPARAEIVVEGFVSATETAPEGPFGDHTGYYNTQAQFPVMRVTAITHRERPFYLSTFTGRAPDEPSVLAEALMQVFKPLLRQQFPEVVDAWLPPETCSYRTAVVALRKTYPGQARRVMMGLWSCLSQFTMTKMIIVVDPDIDIRDWKDVMWAVATRADPSRDLLVMGDMAIDTLDFAAPQPGLGGKLGIDATLKIPPESTQAFPEIMRMPADVVERVDDLWQRLGLDGSGPTGPAK
jgi:4-hydroxy-3-polyprenylbenzoate decarboxylase